MHIRTLMSADYPIIDSYMQELHALHVRKSPDLFLPADHIYSEQDFFEITTGNQHHCTGHGRFRLSRRLLIAALRTKSNMVSGPLTIYVDDLFVHPDYRGQHIATALFDEMEQQAKSLKAVRIDLMVWEFNEAAQELYKSLGMTARIYFRKIIIKNPS